MREVPGSIPGAALVVGFPSASQLVVMAYEPDSSDGLWSFKSRVHFSISSAVV